MALSVGQVQNPTLVNAPAYNPQINGVAQPQQYHSVAPAPGAVATWAPGAAPHNASAPAPQPGGGSPGGGGGGGGTPASSINAANINSTYDTNSNYYRGLLGTVDPQRNQTLQDANGVFDSQIGGIQQQRDAAFRNLDTQTNVANQSYGRGLQQLGNSIRNQYQGQSNAQGIQGAGDSSATGMLGYALGQQQNQQRGYMSQDLNNQMQQIGNTKDAAQGQFQSTHDQIQAQRKQALDGISNQYASLIQNINTQLVNNEQARKQALMYAGQWAAGQAGKVDSGISNALESVKNAYSPGNLPHVEMGQLPSYTAHNVVAPTVPVQSQLSRPVDNSPLQQIYDPRRQDQNQLY